MEVPVLEIEDLIEFSFTHANKILCGLVMANQNIDLLTAEGPISNKKAVHGQSEIAYIFLDFLTKNPTLSINFLKGAVAQEVEFLRSCFSHQAHFQKYINADDINKAFHFEAIKKRLLMRAELMNKTLETVLTKQSGVKISLKS